MKAERVSSYLENVLETGVSAGSVSGAAIDSRLVEPGNIFFAYKGKEADGNKYAAQALDKGASVVVMDDPDEYRKLSGNKILVKDAYKAIFELATARAADIKAIKIAVTGSFGKTSTKDMLDLLLRRKYSLQSSQGNYNNLLGVNVTLCGINDSTEVAVFEMGSNAMGEIAELSRLVKPNIAVLTGVGYAHIGEFGSIENITAEKLSLVDYMVQNGTVVANEQFVAGLEHKDVKKIIIDANSRKYSMSYPYPHLAANFALVAAVGELLGLQDADIVAAAKEYHPRSGRGNLIHAGELYIIDETYNASLESVKSTLNSLLCFDIKPKHYLVGEILEISGHEAFIYREIVAIARNTPDVKFILSGISYANYDVASYPNITIAKSHEDTVKALDNITSGIIAIKASRGCKFERYRDTLIKRLGGENAL